MMHEEEISLFRSEVNLHRQNRVIGDVILKPTISLTLVTYTLALVLLCVIGWASIATFARTETVRGVLMTIRPSAKVISMSSGVVERLSATEGAPVKRGQRLAIVALDRRSENGKGRANQSLMVVKNRINIAISQLNIERQRSAAEKMKLLSIASSAAAEAKNVSKQIELQGDLVNSRKVQLNQLSQIVDKGFLSRQDFEKRRHEFLSAEQNLIGLEQQRELLLAKAIQARSELRIIESQSGAQQNALKSEELELKQREIELNGDLYYEVVAPIDGIITAVQTAEGRTANAGATLLTIVPPKSALYAEVYAPSKAIGFAKIGQEVRLLYDAFPYEHFGSFGGRITAISKTAIDPKDNETRVEVNEPVYRITVSLTSQDVPAYGSNVSLQPGMTLTANLILERQNFLSWLLIPLRAAMNRS